MPKSRPPLRRTWIEYERYGIPRILCVCKLSRHCGCSMQYRSASFVFTARSGPSIGCRKKCRKASPAKSSGSSPSADNTSFNSSPLCCTSQRPALGLTHTQSRPAGAAIVPFVSTAISKPRACSASIRPASSCSSGSPPVQTTNRFPGLDPAGHFSSIAAASASARRKLAAARPVHIRKIRIAELADRRRAILLRAPTRDCSPQSGKRPPRAPPARPRPAAYRKFL